MINKRNNRRRRGAVLVLAAVMMVAMFALLALAVDLGYVTLVRTELQSSADAAALAATWELYDSRALLPESTPYAAQSDVFNAAQYYASRNTVAQAAPELAFTDFEYGRLDPASSMNFIFNKDDPSYFNAVRVRVRRTADINGEVPLFFARVVGVDSNSGEAEAIAMFRDNFSGFTMPPLDKGNLKVLPFALDINTWQAVLAGITPDLWSWDADNKQIYPWPDGVPEANLFPQGTGSPGNRGTVDVGASNNSTADIRRQILQGVSQADLDHIGGKLELGPDGTLELNGDTGISAGMKDALASIKGKPRVIPLFATVVGPGNNATYTIVGFAGVRIMDVNLTGQMSSKRVIIQPAKVKIHGGIPAPDDAPRSYNIYSPVWLVR
ncbi:MAG: hypothetical protein GX594_02545 [Pirellulaceae bacterium]|nr:hypothetical protein [Pirellulaceae bacterium]